MMDNQSLTISQVADMTALPASTIRYYDQQFGEFLDISRGKGRRRCFSSRSVDLLLQVHGWLKNEGLSLRQVRTRLGGTRADAEQEHNEAGQGWQAEVTRLRHEVSELKAIQAHILNILEKIVSKTGGG
ncbi:MAG: MerR family transcriptional regulator [Desulfarculales bacterium]|nr:MerR family transcriptional regulator [Desulfarculales bacterium]